MVEAAGSYPTLGDWDTVPTADTTPRFARRGVGAAVRLRATTSVVALGTTPTRLAKHEDGSGSAVTRTRRPVELIYSELCPSLREALARQRQIKRWTRAK